MTFFSKCCLHQQGIRTENESIPQLLTVFKRSLGFAGAKWTRPQEISEKKSDETLNLFVAGSFFPFAFVYCHLPVVWVWAVNKIV